MSIRFLVSLLLDGTQHSGSDMNKRLTVAHIKKTLSLQDILRDKTATTLMEETTTVKEDVIITSAKTTYLQN